MKKITYIPVSDGGLDATEALCRSCIIFVTDCINECKIEKLQLKVLDSIWTSHNLKKNL